MSDITVQTREVQLKLEIVSEDGELVDAYAIFPTETIVDGRTVPDALCFKVLYLLTPEQKRDIVEGNHVFIN